MNIISIKTPNSILDKFKVSYKHFIDDPLCCYKMIVEFSVSGMRPLIIIMRKLDKTNESRGNVKDPKYAKFRANRLDVLAIIDLDTLGTLGSITNIYLNYRSVFSYDIIECQYTVGDQVQSDWFDEDLENIYSNGIHYFKTIEGAYFFRQRPKTYTGTWLEFYDNGQMKSTGYYVNGEETGRYMEWDENGTLGSNGLIK